MYTYGWCGLFAATLLFEMAMFEQLFFVHEAAVITNGFLVITSGSQELPALRIALCLRAQLRET